MQNLIESLDICCFDFDPIRTVPLSINLIWLPARLPISRPMWIMQREKKRCLGVWWRRSCMGLTSKPSQAVCILFRGSFIQKMSWFTTEAQKFFVKISNNNRTHIEVYLTFYTTSNRALETVTLIHAIRPLFMWMGFKHRITFQQPKMFGSSVKCFVIFDFYRSHHALLLSQFRVRNAAVRDFHLWNCISLTNQGSFKWKIEIQHRRMWCVENEIKNCVESITMRQFQLKCVGTEIEFNSIKPHNAVVADLVFPYLLVF